MATLWHHPSADQGCAPRHTEQNVTTTYKFPDQEQYGDIAETPLELFSNFATTLGNGVYVKDMFSTSKSKSRSYRKKTKAHPALLPGRYTSFCEYEICLGLCLMTEAVTMNTI